MLARHWPTSHEIIEWCKLKIDGELTKIWYLEYPVQFILLNLFCTRKFCDISSRQKCIFNHFFALNIFLSSCWNAFLCCSRSVCRVLPHVRLICLLLYQSRCDLVILFNWVLLKVILLCSFTIWIILIVSHLYLKRHSVYYILMTVIHNIPSWFCFKQQQVFTILYTFDEHILHIVKHWKQW